MTVRRQLFLNSLLMVVIPTATMLIFGVVFWIAIKTVLVSNGFENTKLLQPMSSVDSILKDYQAEDLAVNETVRDELSKKLKDVGFQIELRLDNQIILTTFSKKSSEYADNFFSGTGEKADNSGVWIIIQDTYMYLKTTGTSAGMLDLAISKSSQVNFLNILNSDKVTVLYVSMLVFIVILSAIVIFFSIIISNQLVKRITVPMNLLLDGVKRIQEGNFDEAVPELGYIEFDQLAATMNQMQQSLKFSQELNEKYEKNRREMLVGISHDLRTPLTSIKSYVQGLKDGVAATPEKQAYYLNVIANKTNDVEGLVQSLFMVSKMQIGAYMYTLVPVELNKFLATTLDSISSDFNAHQVKLIFNYTPEKEVWANIDTTEFARAISNILHNSVKYNPNREIIFTVSLASDDTGVSLTLQDNGVGVQQHELPLLFNAFYRADLSRSNPAEGHGLGLAIVKSIVEGHGGTVAAENNGGLSIKIKIPLLGKEHGNENTNC